MKPAGSTQTVHGQQDILEKWNNFQIRVYIDKLPSEYLRRHVPCILNNTRHSTVNNTTVYSPTQSSRRSGNSLSRRSGNSPRRSGNSPRRTGNSPRRSGNSPRRSGNSPRRSGNSTLICDNSSHRSNNSPRNSVNRPIGSGCTLKPTSGSRGNHSGRDSGGEPSCNRSCIDTDALLGANSTVIRQETVYRRVSPLKRREARCFGEPSSYLQTTTSTDMMRTDENLEVRKIILFVIVID